MGPELTHTLQGPCGMLVRIKSDDVYKAAGRVSGIHRMCI